MDGHCTCCYNQGATAPVCRVCFCTWQFQRRAATSTRVAFNHASNTAMFASGDYLICMFMEHNQPETSTPLICIATHTRTPEGAVMDLLGCKTVVSLHFAQTNIRRELPHRTKNNNTLRQQVAIQPNTPRPNAKKKKNEALPTKTPAPVGPLAGSTGPGVRGRLVNLFIRFIRFCVCQISLFGGSHHFAGGLNPSLCNRLNACVSVFLRFFLSFPLPSDLSFCSRRNSMWVCLFL